MKTAFDTLMSDFRDSHDKQYRLFNENLRLRMVLRLMQNELEWLKTASPDVFPLRYENAQKTLAKYRNEFAWAFDGQDMPEGV